MALSDIVNLTIVESTSALTRPGFGTPLILAQTPYTSNLVRSYASQPAMIADGFAATDAAYVAAGAIFGQNPHTPNVKIGKLSSLPTYAATLTPVVSGTPSVVFSGSIVTPLAPAGTAFSFSTGASPTVAGACTGIAAAINALAIAGLTATATATVVNLTGTAGLVFSVIGAKCDTLPFVLNYQEITADPATGFATQLASIQAEDNDWYALASVYTSSIITPILATFAEANRKLLVASSHDDDIIGSGTGDLASALKTSARTHTALLHVANRLEFGDCAWLGRTLADDPGSETWKFKTLGGVTAEKLSATQVSNAKGKNCNTYVTIAGANMTQEGQVAGGDFIDNIRFIDWLYTNMQLDVFALLKSVEKLPYSDFGAAQLESVIRARLQKGVQLGGLLPGFTVTVPKASAQLASDRANRYFPSITFVAQLAGAIHSVQVNGTVSV